MIKELSVLAATAVVGYDLLVGVSEKELGFNRQLVAVGLKGSAAAGDTEIRIKVGISDFGTLFNSGTGFPNMDDVKPIGPVFIPAKQPIRIEVVDAPVTNPINLLLVTVP